MKNIFLITMMAVFIVSSCGKTNDKPKGSEIIGKESDPELLGKWMMNYITIDTNNSITSWADTLKFSANNAGNLKTYQFSELEEEIPFLYYTEKDSLFIQINENQQKWTYAIRNDSLIMTKALPLHSSHIERRIYKKTD